MLDFKLHQFRFKSKPKYKSLNMIIKNSTKCNFKNQYAESRQTYALLAFKVLDLYGKN